MSVSEKKSQISKGPADELEPVEYETDPNAHNRVEAADRGPGMDEPVHYTFARPDERPAHRDVRLIEAVKSGDRDRVKKLLKEGVDIHQRAEQDWTALNFAAGRGDLEMVKLLVGASVDLKVTGRDRRTALAIAKAAERKEVVQYLTEKEKAAGVWEDPTKHRPYCRAYYLRDLRKFKGWSEKKENWKINKHWSEDLKVGFEKNFDAEDVVFVHQDLTVTRSMWHGEHVIFDEVTTEWRKFCERDLKFSLPEDLQ
jgi:hypothetical protein